mmetsp:Transcript_25993/g.61842  ORF Transcript_25993/g.61842 Transcript_25993/m.61842 type:complete len:244 (-) Transcript_25993:779-1510(-)
MLNRTANFDVSLSSAGNQQIETSTSISENTSRALAQTQEKIKQVEMRSEYQHLLLETAGYVQQPELPEQLTIDTFLQLCSDKRVINALSTLLDNNQLPKLSLGKQHQPQRLNELTQTLCALWTILKRARLQAPGSSVFDVLAALWIVESFGDSSRSNVSVVLQDYLGFRLAPETTLCLPGAVDAMLQWRSQMVRAQAVILNRCDWIVRVDRYDILAAERELLSTLDRGESVHHILLKCKKPNR